MEIEKKYRICRIPENLESYPKEELEQGYLCQDPVIRIRKSREAYVLTYKSKLSLADGTRLSEHSARVCEELEVPLTKSGYLHLREKTDGRIIHKKRYRIPYKEHMIELDIFEDFLEGLCFAEVEFESEAQAEVFVKPEWFGEEVTFDPHFSNRYLGCEYEGSYREQPF